MNRQDLEQRLAAKQEALQQLVVTHTQQVEANQKQANQLVGAIEELKSQIASLPPDTSTTDSPLSAS